MFVEIPRNKVSFHCKGISMEDKVTKSQFLSVELSFHSFHSFYNIYTV